MLRSRIFFTTSFFVIALMLVLAGCDRLMSPTSSNQIPTELTGTYNFVGMATISTDNNGMIRNSQVSGRSSFGRLTLRPDGTWEGLVVGFFYSRGYYTLQYPNRLILRGTALSDSTYITNTDTIQYEISYNGYSLRLVRNLSSQMVDRQGMFGLKQETGSYVVGGYLQMGNAAIPPANTVVTAVSKADHTYTALTDEYGFYAFGGVAPDTLRIMASFDDSRLDTTIAMSQSPDYVPVMLQMHFEVPLHGTPLPYELVGTWTMLGDYFYDYQNNSSNSPTITPYPPVTTFTIRADGRWTQTCSSDPSRNRVGYCYNYGTYAVFVTDSAANPSVIGDSASYESYSFNNRILYLRKYVNNANSGIVCILNDGEIRVCGTVQIENRYGCSNATLEYFNGMRWTSFAYSGQYGEYSGMIPVTATQIRVGINYNYNRLTHLYEPQQSITRYITPVPGHNSVVNFSFTSTTIPVRFYFSNIESTPSIENVELVITGTTTHVYNILGSNPVLSLPDGDYTVQATKVGYNPIYAYLPVHGTSAGISLLFAPVGYVSNNDLFCYIVDENYDGIAGARVDILHGGTIYADSTGQFELSSRYCYGTVGLEVSCPGYQTKRMNLFSYYSGNYIIMRPAGSE